VVRNLPYWPLSTSTMQGVVRLRTDEVQRCAGYAKAYRAYTQHLRTV
jgi:hypothetical protein